MLNYILKGAEGKSRLITMETLQSDVAKILPTFKIILFTSLISFISGYFRIVLFGFHPVLQGALIGLALGTINGKTLAVGGQYPKNNWLIVLYGFLISLAALVIHYYAMGKAFPGSGASFLFLSWFANDMREIPQLIPTIGIGTMQEAVSRNLWLVAIVVDATAFFAALIYSMLQAGKSHKHAKNQKSEWKIYRMLLLVFALYGSVFITQKDSIKPNFRKLTNWTDEVWSHHYLELIYQHLDGINAADSDSQRLQLEDILRDAVSMKREFPEGHYLIAIEQLAKGNFYLARDELGRAIFATEQMTRRTWMEDGTVINRDMLLAQLYQLRAKLNLQKENFLAAERDLTVAIFIHKDFWLDTPDSMNRGFFRVEADFLNKANLDPTFGFGACYYERYLARKTLDAEQAMDDLKEAASYGYPVPESGLVLPE